MHMGNVNVHVNVIDLVLVDVMDAYVMALHVVPPQWRQKTVARPFSWYLREK